jgi:hypothetical protein
MALASADFHTGRFYGAMCPQIQVRIPRCLQRAMNSNSVEIKFIGEYHEPT